jgi:hypothetical protein
MSDGMRTDPDSSVAQSADLFPRQQPTSQERSPGRPCVRLPDRPRDDEYICRDPDVTHELATDVRRIRITVVEGENDRPGGRQLSLQTQVDVILQADDRVTE